MDESTTALQERIARALYEEDKRDAANAGLTFDSDAAWKWARDWTAVVLPIIAAEVQAAKAEAWDEGCVAAEQYYKRTVVGVPGSDPIPAPLNPHRETGDRA